MKKLWFLCGLLGVLASFGFGCSVSSTLNAPCPESALLEFPENWLGRWYCIGKDGAWTLDLARWQPESGKRNVVQAVLVTDAPETGKSGRWVPMVGGMFRAGDRRFFAVMPDMEALCKESGYATNSLFLMQPRIYLFRIEGSADEPTLRFVSFTTITYKSEERKPVSPEIREQDGFVLNSTDELYLLLEQGKFLLDEQVFTLKRSK